MKICSGCADGIWQSFDNFYTDSSKSDGLTTRCKVCIKAKRKSHYKSNTTSVLSGNKRWVMNNQQEARLIKTRSRMKLRDECLMAYGGICNCCGVIRNEYLCIDHIDGGGGEHRKQLGNGGRYIYAFLKRNGYPSGYRVLCHNCNLASAICNGVCPHVRIPATPDTPLNRYRQSCLDHYGRECVCGESIERFLVMDHIKGGSNKHRSTMTVSSIYRWLMLNNFPDEFRTLCNNCNVAAGLYGIDPMADVFPRHMHVRRDGPFSQLLEVR